MRRTRILALAAALGAVSLVTSERRAAAQQTGFAVDRFEPSERGSNWFVNDSLDLRGRVRPALGVVGDYGYKPLVAYDLAGNERTAIVRHQLFLHLGGSLVLWDRLRLGVNLPVAVFQDGDATVVNGVAFEPADKASVSDLRISADVRLVGETTDPFTLAIGMRVWAPTGMRSQFTSDGSVRLGPQALVAGDIGLFTYAARLAIIYRARDDSYGGSDLGSELFGSAAAGIRAIDRRLVVGPEAWASSVFSGSDTFFKTRSTPVEWIMGIHYDVVRDFRVGGGVGSGLTRGYGAPELRALLSMEWAPAYGKPRSDRDRDGVFDDEDACPEQYGVRTDDPQTNGCPPKETDRDHDGIVDEEDACPDTPGVHTDDPKTNGCADSDKDGIVDPVDACPAVAGVRSDDPKINGCPDADGDSVVDAVDACPAVPGVRTDNPKTNGCPPDRDHDDVLDADDACPEVPGPKSPDPAKNGCPLVFVTPKEIKISEQVKFKFDSAVILKESDPLLDAVRQVFVDHPEIKRVRVEGHTDNVGQPAYNKTLSGKRAASVAKWLTDHGIAKDRLVSQGFGMDMPLDTNSTPEGRANNRRVNFVILEKEETPKTP